MNFSSKLNPRQRGSLAAEADLSSAAKSGCAGAAAVRVSAPAVVLRKSRRFMNGEHIEDTRGRIAKIFNRSDFPND